MTATASRLERIEQTLRQAFAPVGLVLRDDSHLHRGHAGSADGKGHFHARIVSSAFAGKALVARHRMVYSAVAALMETDIHALGIEALTPDEAAH